MVLLFTTWAVIIGVLLILSVVFFVLGLRIILDRTALSIFLIGVSVVIFIQIYGSLRTILWTVF